MESETRGNLLKIITAVILIALLLRILICINYHPMWWDAAAYIGTGKYIFSLGENGLFEPLRPIIWPMLIGLLWKININPILGARALSTIFGVLSIYLLFLITLKIFDRRTSVLSTIFFAMSHLFIFYEHTMLSEIPSLFFALLSINFFLKKKDILSGCFAGLSFLTKFPQFIIFASLIVYVMFPAMLSGEAKNKKGIEKRIVKSARMTTGFIIPVLPYLTINYFLYKNPLLPFIEANSVIKKTLPHSPLYFYIVNLVKENFTLIFFIPALFLITREFRYSKKRWAENKGIKKGSFKKRERNLNKDLNEKALLKCLFMIFSICFLTYFSALKYKEMRFAIIFLPYLFAISAYGITKLVKNKKALLVLIAIFLIQSAYFFFQYQNHWEAPLPDNIKEGFYRRIIGKEGIIWVSNPGFTLYTDAKINLMYYPTFEDSSKTLIKRVENADFIFLNTCELVCRTGECDKRKNELLYYLEKNFRKEFEIEVRESADDLEKKCKLMEFKK